MVGAATNRFKEVFLMACNPINFDNFDIGDQIRVIVNNFNQIGFFIAFQNQFLYWGTIIDGQARLVTTPLSSIDLLVKI